MRIIQTLWLPKTNENPIKSKCGWLSAEFHWMSWILSFKSLQKYYSQIELYTNQAGKEVLINQLKLPYSKVHLVFDGIDVPESSWVYYKIFTYSLQHEPFVHIDGDVYLSKAFPKTFSESAIVAQNRESNFTFYQATLDILNEKNIQFPAIFYSQIPQITYNAGIIGGKNLPFFKEYSGIVLEYIKDNHESLKDLDSSNCAMLLEQGVFSILVKKYQIQVECAFEQVFDDVLYPGLGNLYEANNEKWYFHFMGLTKSNRFYLKLLASKLKLEYPDEYYSMLRICQESGLVLDYKVYDLDELSLLRNENSSYKKISDLFQINKRGKNKPDWLYLYAKDSFIYQQVVKFQTIKRGEFEAQRLLKTKDFKLLDTSDEATTSQQIILMDTLTLEKVTIDLEDLEIILLSIISDKKAKSFKQITDEMSPYFSQDDFNENIETLNNLLLEKIERLIFRGIIYLVL
jgi:hypothetical protein